MENLHQPNDIINQRYRIVTPLGQGSMGTTYEAEDLTNYQRVAIKVVSLRQATNWKLIELFEREARVLASLDHPQIPNYLDYFEIETDSEVRFYLVQELVQGESLATILEKYWCPTEIQVKDIGIQVLKILEYLHSFTPPVIHRDIKPQNIIRRPDGQVYLVDFGAVQDVYRNTMTRGGTFVGTLGYMPLEQFRGQVKPASDLYSLGASLLFLLTGKSPADLPQVMMKIDWRSQVNISAEFADWLEKMLEPALEDRLTSAKEALKALLLPKFEGRNLPVLAPKNPPPEGSRITVEMKGDRAVIKFPPLGFGFLGLLILSPLILVSSWALISAVSAIATNGISAVFSWLFLGAFLGLFWYAAINTIQIFHRIEIDRENFTIESVIRGSKKIIMKAKTVDIEKVEIETNTRYKGGKTITCAIWEGIHRHTYGDSLSMKVKDWLATELSHLIKLMQS